MKNYLRRVIALMMSVMMLCGSLPVTAIADALETLTPPEQEQLAIPVDSVGTGEDAALAQGGGTANLLPETGLPVSVDVPFGTQPFANLDIMPLAQTDGIEITVHVLENRTGTASDYTNKPSFLVINANTATPGFRFDIKNSTGEALTGVSLTTYVRIDNGSQAPGSHKFKANNSSGNDSRSYTEAGSSAATETVFTSSFTSGSTMWAFSNGGLAVDINVAHVYEYVVTVEGYLPSGKYVRAEGVGTVVLNGDKMITVRKEASVDGGATWRDYDISKMATSDTNVQYRIAVTNYGTSDQTLQIADVFTVNGEADDTFNTANLQRGSGNGTYDGSTGTLTIKGGTSSSANTVYLTTNAKYAVEAGQTSRLELVNTVTATDSNGNVYTDDARVTILPYGQAFSITKSYATEAGGPYSSERGKVTKGDAVYYQLLIRNTGVGTLTLSVTDSVTVTRSGSSGSTSSINNYTRNSGTNGATYSGGTVTLPEGGYIVLRTSSSVQSIASNGSGWANGDSIVSTVTVRDSDEDHVYDPADAKEQSTSLELVYNDDDLIVTTLGYSLVIANADFPTNVRSDMQEIWWPKDSNFNDTNTREWHKSWIFTNPKDTSNKIRIVENGVTDTGARKYANGFVESSGNLTSDGKKLKNGASVKTTSVEPVGPKGYYFLGWYDKTGKVFYKPGASVNVTKESNIYSIDAIWAHMNAHDKTVIYNGSGYTLDLPELMLDIERGKDDYIKAKETIQTAVTSTSATYSYTYTGVLNDGTTVSSAEAINLGIQLKDGYDGYGYELKDFQGLVEAGVYEITITAKFSVAEHDVEINETATLTILPRPVLAEVQKASFAFDGQEHTLASLLGAGLGNEYKVTGTTTAKFTSEIEGDLDLLDQMKAAKDLNNESLWKDSSVGLVSAFGHNLTSSSQQISIVYIDPTTGGEITGPVNAGEYPARIKLNLSAGAKTPTIKNSSNQDVTRNYAFYWLPGTLTITGVPLTIHKEVVDESFTQGGSFNFTVTSGGRTLRFDKTADGAYYEVATGGSTTVTINVAAGAKTGEVTVWVQPTGNNTSLTCTVTEQNPGTDYTVTYSTNSNSGFAASSPEVTVTRSGADVYVRNTANFYYVEHYIIDLNDTFGTPVSKNDEGEFEGSPKVTADGVALSKDPYGFTLASRSKQTWNDTLTYQGVHNAHKSDSVSIMDQDYRSGNSESKKSSSGAITSTSDTTTSTGDSVKSVYVGVYDDEGMGSAASAAMKGAKLGLGANKIYLDEYTGSVPAGGTVQLYWVRSLTETVTDDGLAVTAHENPPSDSKNAVRQGQTYVYTHYVLLGNTNRTYTANSQYDNIEQAAKNLLKFRWQSIDKVDVIADNSWNNYIFHSAVARQWNNSSSSFDVLDAEDVTDAQINLIDNAWHNDHVDLYLVPKISVEYYVNGALDHTDSTNYTVDRTAKAAGEWKPNANYTVATNGNVGTTYPYAFTVDAIPDGPTDGYVTTNTAFTTDTWSLKQADDDDGTAASVGASLNAEASLYYKNRAAGTLDNVDHDSTKNLVSRLHLYTYRVEKTVDKATAESGELLTYTITITNYDPREIRKSVTDALTVNGVSKTAPTLSGSGYANGFVTVPGATYAGGSVTPGTVTLTATYTVQSNDVGAIVNTVTLDGPNGPTDSATTTVEENPEWTVTKTPTIVHNNINCGDETADEDNAHVGDRVDYLIRVTNTGNVPLTLTLGDLFTVDGVTKTLTLTNDTGNGGVAGSASSFTLNSGEFIDFTAQYTVLLDDKQLVNKATASNVDDPEDSVEITVTTDVNNPRWTVSKGVSGMTGDIVDGAQAARAGDTLTYTITVTNTGNVSPLTGLVFTDTFEGVIDLSEADVVGGSLTKQGDVWVLDMAEGVDETTISYTYVVQAEDVGQAISNKAEVESAPGKPTDPTGTGHSDTTSTETEGWSIVKELYSVNGNQVTDGKINGEDVKLKVDDEVHYRLIVKNEGSVVLDRLAVTDVLEGILAASANQPNYVRVEPDTTEARFEHGKLNNLDVGETVYLIYYYKVQDGDAFLSNTAKASKPKYTPEGNEDRTKTPNEETDGPVDNVVYGSVTVHKRWMESDGTTPLAAAVREALLGEATITINVLQSDGEGAATNVGTVTMPRRDVQTGEDPWSMTFENLPLAKDKDTLYTYTVEEAGVADGKITLGSYTYGVVVSGDNDERASVFDFNVTNVLQDTPEDERTDPEKEAEALTDDSKVQIDDYIKYTIRHISPMALTTTAIIADTLPTGLVYVNDAPQHVTTVTVNGEQVGNATLTNPDNVHLEWSVPGVPPLAEIEITFYVKVTADAVTIVEDTLNNKADVTQKDNNSNVVFEDETDETTVDVKKPDLGITKTATDLDGHPISAVIPGMTFFYEITVTNNGTGKAKGIEVEDTLSQYLKYLEPVAPAGSTVSLDGTTLTPMGYSGTVKWTIDELAGNRASATLKVKVKLYMTDRGHVTADKRESADGNDALSFIFAADFDNTATVEAGDRDKQPSEKPTAEKHVDIADFVIQKDVEIDNRSGGDPETAELGDGIDYTITVRNIGGTALENLVVHDDMFAYADDGKVEVNGVEQSVGEGNTVTIAGPMPTSGAGSQVTITFTRTVTPELIAQYGDDSDSSIVNTVDAHAEYRENPDDAETKDTHVHWNSAEVTLADRERGWVVKKEIVPESMTGVDENGNRYARVGDRLTFKISVTNMGNVVLHTLRLTDVLTVGDYDADLIGLLDKDPASKTEAEYDYEGGSYGVITNLRPGETIILTYTRTNNPIKADEIGLILENEVKVTHSSAPNEYKPDDPTDDPNTDKVSTPIENYGVVKTVGVVENGSWVELKDSELMSNPDVEGVPAGTVLVYHITVTNKSAFELHDILVTDTFEGGKLSYDKLEMVAEDSIDGAAYDQATGKITRLPAGDTAEEGKITLAYTYTVAEGDVGRKLKNAVAVGTDSSTTVESSEVETKVDKYSVEKSVTDGTVRNGEGEEIALPGTKLTYTITITNEGETELNGLVVTDTWTVETKGDPAKQEIVWDSTMIEDLTVTGSADESKVSHTVSGKELIVSGIAVGESVTITYTVEVPEEEDGAVVVALKNVAVIGEGNDKHETEEVETPVGQWSIDKELTLVDGEPESETNRVKAGKELTYTVTVTNEGEVALYDLAIGDTITVTKNGGSDTSVLTYKPGSVRSLTGGSPEFVNGRLNVLGVGESVTLQYTYLVQEEDLYLSNVSTATKTGDDPTDPPTHEEESDPVRNPVYRDLDVEKKWVDSAGVALSDDVLEILLGEAFSITVQLYRDGDAQTGETITLSASDDAARNWKGTFADLPATDAEGTPYTYTVKEAGEDEVTREVEFTYNGVKYVFTVSGGDVAFVEGANHLWSAELTNTMKNNDPVAPTKEADKDSAEMDEVIQFTITRQSHVSAQATATIVDELGDYLAYVETVSVKVNGEAVECDGVKDATNGQLITWTVEHVPPMATIEVVFTAKVTEEAIKYDKLLNQATVKLGDSADDKFTTNEEEVDVLLPELSIAKTANLKTVQPGGELQYTLEVENSGAGVAKDVKVEDTLPEEVDWESAEFDPDDEHVTYDKATGKITWIIPKLEGNPGQEGDNDKATLTVTVTVKGGLETPLTDADGEYVRDFANAATITDGMPRNEDGTPKDTDEERTDTARTDVADIEIVKVATDNVAVGDDGVKRYKANDKITYTVTVTNIGGAELSDVTISDDMFAKADQGSMTVKNGETPTAFTCEDGVVTLTDPLAAGDVVVIEYTYTITQTDLDTLNSIPNVAKANATYPDTEDTTADLDEHEDDEDTPIPSKPALDVVKKLHEVRSGEATVEVSDDMDVHVRANDVLTYWITITNTGNVTLTGLSVQDLFQSAEVEVEPVVENDSRYDKAQKLITSLSPEESITLAYTYDAVAGTDAFLKNVVTVTGKVLKDPENDDPTDDDYYYLSEEDSAENIVYRNLTVTKSWTDGDGAELDADLLEALIGEDASITVALYRSEGDKEAQAVAGQEATLDKDNGWTATFEDLPAATGEGVAYSYEVREIGEDGAIADNGEATVNDLTFKVTYDLEGPDEDGDGLLEATVTNELQDDDPEEKLTEKTADEADPADGDNDGVEIGDTITYTVTRQSHLSAPSLATIIDTLPEGLDYNENSAVLTVDVNGVEMEGLTLNENVDGQTVTWTIEKVPPMATVTITYTVTVNADAIKHTELENDAKVGFGDPTDEDIFKGDSDTVEVLRPELRITKLANVDTVKPGTTFHYTLTVVNSGMGRAEDVVVEDTLPEYLTLVSCDPSDAVEVVTDESGLVKLVWSVGDLSNEEDGDNTAALVIEVAVKDDDEHLVDSEGNFVTVISNTATITEGMTPRDPADPDDPDDPEDDPYSSTFDADVADLRIEKTGENEDDSRADSDIYRAGDKYVYTIEVENIGSADLTNVTVEDARFETALINADYDITVVLTTADGEVETLEISPVDNVLTIPALNVGDIVTITYVYEITQEDLEDVDLHIIRNTATAKGTYETTNPEDPTEPPEEEETNEHSDTDELPVDAVPELEVEKTVSGMSGRHGEDVYARLNDVLTYTVTVTNTGNVTLSAVEITDDMFRLAVDGIVMVSINGATAEKAVVTGNRLIIDTLPVGQSAEITYSYTVVQQDILNGHVYNKVTADADDPHDKLEPKSDEEDVDTDDMHSELKLLKRVAATSQPKNGVAFVEGETITFEIVVTNDGNVTRMGDVIDELLAGATFVAGTGYQLLSGGTKAKIAKLEPDESITLTAVYTVKQQDVVNGSLNNVVVGGDGTTPNPGPDNTPAPTPTNSDGTLPTPTPKPSASVQVTPEKPEPRFTIVKAVVNAPANGEKFTLNETIRYEITVVNTGNVDLTDVTIEDQLQHVVIAESRDYTVIEGGVIIRSMPVGAAVTIKATYVVTEADILAGSVENVAVGSAKGPSPDTTPTPDPSGNTPEPGTTATPIPVPEPTPGVVETDTVPKKGHLTLEKTVTNKPANSSGYVLGETITYEVRVTNDGNLTITDIVVTDELTGNVWTVASLAPGESTTFTTSYAVTEADVLAGKVLNVVTAKGKSPDPEQPDVPVDPDEVESKTEPKRGHLTLEKTVTNKPENGKAYVLGETITYEVKVTNDGNLTITDIVVTDELTGDRWTVVFLAPGESKTFTTSHVVTEADVLAGKVLNAVTAKGKSPDPEQPDVPVDPDEVESKTEPKRGHLTLEKTVTNKPADSDGYVLGETVTYEVRVTNDGNLTITDIEVTDELTGDRWTVKSLAPGESETFTTSHVVTEDDVLAGKVLNVVTAKGKSPDPEQPDVPVDPDEVESKTERKQGHLTVEKTVTNRPMNGIGYAKGETIAYEIVVTNDGNLTLTNIAVTDELTGDRWTIESLEPGESKTFTASYTVTEADTEKGTVVNVATAKGKSPDPERPNVSDDSDEVISQTTKPPVNDGTPTYKLTKTATNLPARGYYEVGETVEYTINVLNTGSVAIIGFTLTDQLNGATILPGNGYTVKSTNEALIERLRVGQSVDVRVSYTVTREDVQRGNVRNVASGAGVGSNGRKPQGNVTEVTVPTNEKTYRVTVHYYYLEDGSTAAPDQSKSGLRPSDEYDFISPEIDGYWTLTTRVSGKTPAHDVEITVFYIPNSISLPGMLPEVEDQLRNGMMLVLLDEYGVPMGIGSVMRNVGDCFE